MLTDHHPQFCSPTTELIGGQGWQTREGFIDGIHLQLRHLLLQQSHHPLAHIAIEGVVGAAHHHLLIAQAIRHLEIGRAHGNAQLPGLTAAGHDAAIVIGEHHHRLALQRWIKQLLARGIEVVAINQSQRCCHGRSQGMDHMGGHTPDLNRAATVQVQRRITGMGRL